MDVWFVLGVHLKRNVVAFIFLTLPTGGDILILRESLASLSDAVMFIFISSPSTAVTVKFVIADVGEEFSENNVKCKSHKILIIIAEH